MRKRFSFIFAPGVATLATAICLLGCQTAKPKTTPQPAAVVPQRAPGTLSIVPKTSGFAPEGSVKTEVLSLSYGASHAVQSWKLEILDASGADQKVFSGNASDLPQIVRWDGRNAVGAFAAEGTYIARLSVSYGSTYRPGSVTSTPFVLDIVPPSGSTVLSTPLFSPIESSPTITLTVEATSKTAKIDSWDMNILDPAGHLFRSFSAAWPDNQAVWDGKGIKGDLVQSAEDYPVVARVSDEFGNVGKLKTVVPVDILVEKTPEGYRILASRIFFKPFTADYIDVRPDLASQNGKRLDDLAAKLKKFPSYKIELVGHAVMIYWFDTKLGALEQKYVLLPLSEARAEAIRQALTERQLDSVMFTTKGVGASDQIVPDSDLADRWQNRRVAFFLVRNEITTQSMP